MVDKLVTYSEFGPMSFAVLPGSVITHNFVAGFSAGGTVIQDWASANPSFNWGPNYNGQTTVTGAIMSFPSIVGLFPANVPRRDILIRGIINNDANVLIAGSSLEANNSSDPPPGPASGNLCWVQPLVFNIDGTAGVANSTEDYCYGGFPATLSNNTIALIRLTEPVTVPIDFELYITAIRGTGLDIALPVQIITVNPATSSQEGATVLNLSSFVNDINLKYFIIELVPIATNIKSVFSLYGWGVNKPAVVAPIVNLNFRGPLASSSSAIAATAQVQVTRTGPTLTNLVVNVNYSGTFPATGRLSPPANLVTVTIPAGVSFKNFVIGAVSPSSYTDFSTYSGNKTIVASLTSSSNYSLGLATSLTITVPSTGQN